MCAYTVCIAPSLSASDFGLYRFLNLILNVLACLVNISQVLKVSCLSLYTYVTGWIHCYRNACPWKLKEEFSVKIWGHYLPLHSFLVHICIHAFNFQFFFCLCLNLDLITFRKLSKNKTKTKKAIVKIEG